MGVGGADNAVVALGARMGRAVAARRGLRHRLGAARRRRQARRARSSATATARRSKRASSKLAFDADEGSFSVWHYEHRFPISPLDLSDRPRPRARRARRDRTRHAAELLAVERAAARDGRGDASRAPRGVPEEAEALKRRLAEAVAGSPGLRAAIERAVSLVNGTPGLPESFGTLHRILEAQSYRLAALAGRGERHQLSPLLRHQRPRRPARRGAGGVRARRTQLIFRLVREGRIQGLRIDHVDGLADPDGYLRALQRGGRARLLRRRREDPRAGRGAAAWPIAGTTGYDALEPDRRRVRRRRERASAFDAHLPARDRASTGATPTLLRAAKTEILETSFASELEVLVSDLKRIADARPPHARLHRATRLRRALVEIIARFPVYRTYLDDGEPSPEDRALIEETVARRKRRQRAAGPLGARLRRRRAARPDRDRAARAGPTPSSSRRFRRRFQQLTGPVMAKSLEDTLFYRYVPALGAERGRRRPGRFRHRRRRLPRARTASARATGRTR